MPFHPSVRETLDSLQKIAPDAPLLALGQTVFWDEPLKVMLPIIAEQVGSPVRLTAGIHDTDYFAKLPGGIASTMPFIALAKNDGTTKNFWSAAGEFSSLFGSETPATRESLAQAGAFLEKQSKTEPSFLDHITEAYGWRGIAARDSRAQITSELSLEGIFPFLQKTFQWALAESMSLLEGEHLRLAEMQGDRIQTLMCDTRESCRGQTLATFYECLLSDFHELVSGRKAATEITRTSSLLSFSKRTAHLPRFAFVDLFLREETKLSAINAYNSAVAGTETYTLDKFGTGAIPFDLVIPGVGRGTIRITKNALIVMTPEPKFASISKPIGSIQDLAEAVDSHFENSVLVGKAVTLISMLSSEFVFAFHETASPYVEQTRQMNNAIANDGIELRLNPILRIGLDAWDAIDAVTAAVRLPAHLGQAFGSSSLSGSEFSNQWREAMNKQCEILTALGKSRSPQAVIETISTLFGGEFTDLKNELAELGSTLHPLRETKAQLEAETKAIHERLRQLKREWSECETMMGDFFRSGNISSREQCIATVAKLRIERRHLRQRLLELQNTKSSVSNTPQIKNTRERRKQIELRAEEVRLQLARTAILTKRSLDSTNRRPAAWWFPIVSPDGAWFTRLMHTAKFRLQPIIGDAA